MNYAVNFICRIRMGRRMRGFEAAALVNGHVHNHGAWLHGLQHLSIEMPRATPLQPQNRFRDDVALDFVGPAVDSELA